MTQQTTLTPDRALGRREMLVVVALTLVAAWLRGRGFGQAGLVHFDEGIYALAGLWSLSPRGLAGLDPQLISYAPPGFPILVGVAYGVLGVSDSAALVVSMLLGVVAVPAAAWVGRRTFGAGGGAATAAFAALSMAHVAFSRKALTDAPFVLAWLGVIGLGGRFLERPTVVRASAFGLSVGVAQNLKYNGWLGLIVVAVAAVLGVLSSPESRRIRTVVRTFGLGLLAGVVTASSYWPWYHFVEANGGYAALIRHHRGYVGGPQAWLPHWKTQLAGVIALSGGVRWNALAWIAAWVGAGVSASGTAIFSSASRWHHSRYLVGGLVGVPLLVAVPDLAWWVGLAWVGSLAVNRSPARRVLAAWWLVFSILTPLYHPYARLWLPLHAAGWVLLAGVVVRVGPFVEYHFLSANRALFPQPMDLVRGTFALACLLAACFHWGGVRPRPLPDSFVFSRSDGFRVAAASLAEPAGVLAVNAGRLRVFGRRPLAYYLALRGVGPFRLVPGREEVVRGPAWEWVLVDSVQYGPNLVAGGLDGSGTPGWQRVTSWRLCHDAVTELDADPDAAFEGHVFETPTLILFAPRVSPPSPPPPASPSRTRESER